MNLRNILLVIFSTFILAGCLKVKDQNESIKNTAPLETKVTYESCEKDISLCAAIDIENPSALKAYEKGCAEKEYYACFRLGQLHELKNKDIALAVQSYERGCEGFDHYSCAAETELRSSQCYLENKKGFCKGEPKGEYRMLLFLQNLNPKYQDAFVAHNFSYSFSLEPVNTLYKKRMLEKNKQLLAALKLAKKNRHRDGADAQGLTDEIEKLSSKKE